MFLVEKAKSMVTAIIKTERALITGDIPKRIMEYTCNGKVDDPGPATKNVITKSSSERVTTIRNPEMIPGDAIGSTTFKSVSTSRAPRSYAASIMVKSNPSSLAQEKGAYPNTDRREIKWTEIFSHAGSTSTMKPSLGFHHRNTLSFQLMLLSSV